MYSRQPSEDREVFSLSQAHRSDTSCPAHGAKDVLADVTLWNEEELKRNHPNSTSGDGGQMLNGILVLKDHFCLNLAKIKRIKFLKKYSTKWKRKELVEARSLLPWKRNCSWFWRIKCWIQQQCWEPVNWSFLRDGFGYKTLLWATALTKIVVSRSKIQREIRNNQFPGLKVAEQNLKTSDQRNLWF